MKSSLRLSRCFRAVFIICCGIVFTSCTTGKKKANLESKSKPQVGVITSSSKLNYSGPAKIKFDSTVYHLGVINKGQIKKFELFFENVGAENLEISLISSCDCTTVDWPVLPISSGTRKSLKIAYDSKDKSGPQIVDVDVLANTEPKNTYIKFELFVQD
ncbi:MAG: DUF1573 domain-containing protein [Saprospiraceae bacterium]